MATPYIGVGMVFTYVEKYMTFTNSAIICCLVRIEKYNYYVFFNKKNNRKNEKILPLPKLPFQPGLPKIGLAFSLSIFP